MILELAGVRYRYPGVDRDAVGGVTLHVREGELVGIVGPNGSGKTTLLRLLVGVLRASAGGVMLPESQLENGTGASSLVSSASSHSGKNPCSR